LGEIPLDARIRTGGDSGQPVVLAHPDSEAANAFMNAAKMVADRLEKISEKK
jgi:ATP-binding protein involved in chromosome partitioning